MCHRKTPLFRILRPISERLELAYVLSFPRSESHFTKINRGKKVIKIGQNEGFSEPQNAEVVAAQGIEDLRIEVLYL